MKGLSILADLIKYKLSLAVTFSAVTGYLIFRSQPGLSVVFMTAGVYLLSSGAAALNQYSERKYDAIMGRTKQRPLPMDKIGHNEALAISLILIFAGSLMLLLTGIVPVILGLFTIILYNFIYTRLKRVSPFALAAGALVGAIPPLIGYAAAGGNTPDAAIILFSTFMFLWQLPHFWLIMIKYRDEYQLAGFRNFSKALDGKSSRLLVFAWVFLSSLLLFYFTVTGTVFSRPVNIFLIPLNVIFILLFYKLLFSTKGEKDVRAAFILINSFSLIIMIIFIINSFLS
jgi:heme o synthase